MQNGITKHTETFETVFAGEWTGSVKLPDLSFDREKVLNKLREFAKRDYGSDMQIKDLDFSQTMENGKAVFNFTVNGEYEYEAEYYRASAELLSGNITEPEYYSDNKLDDNEISIFVRDSLAKILDDITELEYEYDAETNIDEEDLEY